MVNLSVKLRDEEYRALYRAATDARRDPRDQAALLVVAQLEALGLLHSTNPGKPAQLHDSKGQPSSHGDKVRS